jgi:hypothetical protein
LKPRALGILTAIALAALLVSPASAGLADRIGATFALMADEFVKAAAPVEGLVVSTEGGVLYLDLGESAGAQVGQELTVFRKGPAFVHPVTRKPLGRHELLLGHAQIRRVEPRFSEATFIPLGDRPDPRPEDGARITRARIRVAITPLLDLAETDADVRRVPYLVASVLERSRRFQVIDPLAVGDMFASGAVRVEEVLARPERAVRAARNLEVAGWIVPVLVKRAGVIYLDATWISAVTGTALFSRRLPVMTRAATEEPRFPWEPRAED